MRRILFKLIISIFIFQLLACIGTTQSEVSTQDGTDVNADSLAIRSTIEGWYEAMYKVDSA